MELRDRIRNKQARIGIIGLGYVGLPLAVEFAKAGFEVTGFDVDVTKVSSINKGHSYIGDVASEDVAAAVKAKKLSATDDMSNRASAEASSEMSPPSALASSVLPTPVGPTKKKEPTAATRPQFRRARTTRRARKARGRTSSARRIAIVS